MVAWELPSADTFGISQRLLDAVVRPIQYLRLSGRFFPWTSPVYHGLTCLHLQYTCPMRNRNPFIHGSQLREILLACPDLCTFHININVTGQDISQDLTPVPLNNLEELNLRGLSRTSYDIILPLLAPGSRPLHFTFQTQSGTENPPLYCPLITSFFRRSNVTSLFVLGRSSVRQYLDVDQLLAESPTNLVSLGLQRLRISGLGSTQLDCLKTLPPIRLNRLYLRRCTFAAETLKQMAEIITAQMVKIFKPELYVPPDEDEAKVRQEIASIFPTVKWVCSSLDMDWWNMWGMEYEN
ncbi:hypothetical protein B0J17DRAFT_147379 [Rhizoctonia solani]|nr:hypothetical protein B0J17DRAFT_147379 [Rhizoctonia solani]